VPNDADFAGRRLSADVVDAALAGLRASPKTLPPKLFYDAEGCRLFYQITRLPEYYLTRTELALLRSLGGALLPDDLREAALVEFGGSDETKARCLLDLLDPSGAARFTTYVPIDVAACALAAMRRRLATSDPDLKVVPIEADFLQPLSLPSIGRQRLGFFPGSTIGNLEPDAAVRFLKAARESLGPEAWFLLGVDLHKGSDILLPAYNDAAGVTAAFNLNLLRRLNHEAGADFDLGTFRHEAVWNSRRSRVEMHLISLRDQVVHVAGEAIRFAEGESIHTENSHKFSPHTVLQMVSAAGWEPRRQWTDQQGWFGIFLLRHG
jgi:dimethylhistidine N-methyltransferase